MEFVGRHTYRSTGIISDQVIVFDVTKNATTYKLGLEKPDIRCRDLPGILHSESTKYLEDEVCLPCT